MQTILQDLRYALRQLRLSPVFTLTALLTLALGIGATTAIFSLIHTVMLRSLPVVDPSTLYKVGTDQKCCVWGGMQEEWSLFSYELFHRIQNATPEFEQMAAFQAPAMRYSVRRDGQNQVAKPLRGEFVSGQYFSMFGVGALLGRPLTPRDDQASAAPVAVLSYRGWQQTYGSDPSVLGATFVIEGHPFTIVGIAPPGFFGDTLRSDPPDVWMPLEQEPVVAGGGTLLRQPAVAWLRIIGRLKPGATVQGIPARLTTLLQQWVPQSGLPAEFMPLVMQRLPKQHVGVVPAGGGVGTMKSDYGSSLKILLTVCSLVLLIACANIANLLLARGMARRNQTSVRMALGASRQRLIRQMLTESVLLAVLGGVIGIGVAYGGVRLILALAFRSIHYVPISAAPSWPVLGFAFGLSLVTGVLFGTAPAWFASHGNPAEALRGSNRSVRDSASLPQKVLVVLQATLSVVLLAGAGMLTRSLGNMEKQDFGYPTEDTISVNMNTPLPSYSFERLNALDRELEDRLSHLPGVEHAGLALYTPFTDQWNDSIVVEGKPMAKVGEDDSSMIDRVGPGYFDALGQKIVRGRAINESDTETTRPVAVVTQAFAKKFFKNEDPMGKHFGLDLPAYAGSYEVVGVAQDAKYADPEGPMQAIAFMPLAQKIVYKEEQLATGEVRAHFITGALLRVHRGTTGMEAQIRRAFAEVDPNLTIVTIQTMQEQVASNFDQQRMVARLAGLFGGVALILAAVGLYGVTAYTVARRTSEIGVRMALGANRLHVVQLVLRGAFLQIALGLLIGIPVAVGAGRLMASQLYQVAIWDPLSLGIAIVLLGICAWVAAIIPAQRAASIDPVKALRVE